MQCTLITAYHFLLLSFPVFYVLTLAKRSDVDSASIGKITANFVILFFRQLWQLLIPAVNKL